MVRVLVDFEDFDDVTGHLWGPAERVWRNVKTSAVEAGNMGICDDVFSYLEELFGQGDMTLVELNDFVAYQLSDDFVQYYTENEEPKMAEIAALW